MAIVNDASRVRNTLARTIGLACQSGAYGEYFRLGRFREKIKASALSSDAQSRICELAGKIAEEIQRDPKQTVRQIFEQIKLTMEDSKTKQSIEYMLSQACDLRVNYPISSPSILSFNSSRDLNIEHNIAYQALVFLIRSLPKTDCHVHISNNLNNEEISVRTGDSVESVKCEKAQDDDYYIKTPEDFEWTAKETCLRFMYDGVLKFDLRFNPTKVGRDTIQSVQEGINAAIEEARNADIFDKSSAIEIGMLFSFNRTKKPSRSSPPIYEAAIEALEQVEKQSGNDPLLHGIDISGPEKGIDAANKEEFNRDMQKWASVLTCYKERNLRVTSHLGDFRNARNHFRKKMDISDLNNLPLMLDGYLEFVEAYLAIMPDGAGIGHGYIFNPEFCISPAWDTTQLPVNLSADPKYANHVEWVESMIDTIRQKHMTIEHCPSASIRWYQTVEAYSRLPFRYWVDNGLSVNIGTDAGIFSYNGPRNLSEDLARVMLSTKYSVATILGLVGVNI